MIRVKMKFFSIFKDIIGKDELEFEFEESITIEEILNGLSKKYPYLLLLELSSLISSMYRVRKVRIRVHGL